MTADRDNSTRADDPFERAIAREEAYRQRRSRSMLFPSGVFNTFKWLALGFALAWGGLLALHWTVFGDPRWLAVLHTMIYGVALIYFATLLIAFTVMQRKPSAFGLTDESD